MSSGYYKTIHLLITKGHQITDQVSRELKEFGISEPQYNVLRILFEANGEPVTVQHVQSKMVQKGSNVTRIIDKLQSKELVIRQECVTNRRKMDLLLTLDGKKFLTKLDKKIHAMHAPFMDTLDSKELEQLSALLSKLEFSKL